MSIFNIYLDGNESSVKEFLQSINKVIDDLYHAANCMTPYVEDEASSAGFPSFDETAEKFEEARMKFMDWFFNYKEIAKLISKENEEDNHE